jgi:peptidase M23-like protein
MKLIACGIALLVWSLPSFGAQDGKGAPQSPAVQVTPVLMRVLDAPVAVKGSDARCHVVYEVELNNWTRLPVDLEKVDVLDARDGTVVGLLDAAQIAQRLVVRDEQATPGRLGVAQTGLLYVHLTLDCERLPSALDHRLAATVDAKPLVESAARTQVAPPTDLVLDPPLRGSRYIAADGCCDSIRHVRATLPVNGRAFTAQRFAIDWEQLDDHDRVYVGDPKDPESYIIYNKPVFAAANARVVVAVDGLPNSPIGSLPPNIPIDQADGNHVILDLGDGRFALYAHLAPNSVLVEEGQHVRRGQMLGRVGTSGNSSEPHLHFHVMDAPSALAADGLPYLLTRFFSTRRVVSTAAFDQAVITGEPVPTEPVSGAATRVRVLPLDLWIVDFP